MKAITTYTPESWGNLYFPEGCTDVYQVIDAITENCSIGEHEWSNHGINCYYEAIKQLFDDNNFK